MGQNANIDGVTAPWVKVQTNSGETGWCFGLYLRGTRFDPAPEELTTMLHSNMENPDNLIDNGNTVIDSQNNTKKRPIPLWAWFAIGAVVITGGAAVFVIKRRK
jgi:hypothetical protein